MKRNTRFRWAILTTAALSAGCLGPQRFGSPGQPLPRSGDEIVVCGQLFHTGAPVVLWMDPGGYDAYRVQCRFAPDRDLPSRPAGDPSPNRYGTWRGHLPEDVEKTVHEQGWSLPLLQKCVDQFVIHYDVCGTSRRCFEVLQDVRGLSVHFMLDVDGTIYQTLDLKERAWHAGTANDRSVGIEIANIGAYPDLTELSKWYALDDTGRMRLTLPESMGDGGIRTAGFIARPSGENPVQGSIQGKDLWQYDLTDEQYDSLIKLTATLCKVLPEIRLNYPRDENGALRTTMLTPEEMADYHGLLGHYHVTDAKTDPGPAFDWDRVVTGAKRLMGR